MLQKQANLFTIPFDQLFERVKEHFSNYSYNFQKHTVELHDDKHETIAYIRLPLRISIDKNLNITDDDVCVIYISIESDNGAISIMQGSENVYHTTFSAYMTRKKQGYSQIKHLNKKGKSRAGSRVRLASTLNFFEDINTTLTDILEEHEIERIALSCSPTLIPYLHQSKVDCPFDKHDERLYKIPLHIQQSNYTNLTAAIKKLIPPILFYNEKREDIREIFEEEF